MSSMVRVMGVMSMVVLVVEAATYRSALDLPRLRLPLLRIGGRRRRVCLLRLELVFIRLGMLLLVEVGLVM